MQERSGGRIGSGMEGIGGNEQVKGRGIGRVDRSRIWVR